jgi:phosphate transport system substrate-binding protein
MFQQSQRCFLIVFLVILVGIAAACGTRAGAGRSIVIDGSSTVFPITEAVAEDFGILTGGTVRVTVGVSGTGGGFKKFCNKETDIANASRPVKAVEIEMCAENGVEFIEIPVAIDGITVMVHPDNDFVECITIEEINTIWGPEAERKVTRWNQVRPDWPDRSMHLYGPGVDSGTFDYFTEVVNGQSQSSRGDYTASEDDNVLVRGISGDKKSLGFFGFAFFAENTDRLKAVEVDGGGGCVEPTANTINDGSYSPLSRPLFIYVAKAAAGQAYIKEFVRFFLSQDGRELADEVGYISFPTQVYDLALARFENAKSGSLFGGDTPQRGSVEEVLAANQ